MLYNAKAFKGGNDQLLVALDRFDPQVTCQGTLESDKETCGELTSRISKSYQHRRFGRLGDRTVDVVLPYRIFSRKNNEFQIRITLRVLSC